MSVINTVLNSAEAQEKHWALVDCFATWDGSKADQSVIEDGLFARYRAMGKPLKGLRFRRIDLKAVEITAAFENGDEVNIITVRRYGSIKPQGVCIPDGDTHLGVHLVHGDYFHQHELENLAKFVMDNVYHK